MSQDPIPPSSTPPPGLPPERRPREKTIKPVEVLHAGRKIRHHSGRRYIPRWQAITDGLKSLRTRLRDRFSITRLKKVPPVFTVRPLPPLPVPATHSLLPARGDKAGWAELKQQSQKTAAQHNELLFTKLANALQSENTEMAVEAMYRLRGELLVQSGGNIEAMYSVMEQEILKVVALLKQKEVAQHGDYLNRLQDNLLRLSGQLTPEGDHLRSVLPLTADQSTQTMYNCLQLIKEKLGIEDRKDANGRLLHPELEPEMVQECVNVLSACCTPLENTTTRFLQALQEPDPAGAAGLLDEWLLLAKDELVREGLYPDEERIISRVIKMIPTCPMPEAQRQALVKKLTTSRSRLAQWLLLVKQERETRPTDLKLNALHALHEKLLERLLLGSSMVNWQTKYAIVPAGRYLKDDRPRVKAVQQARQPLQVPNHKRSVDDEMKLPSYAVAGSVKQFREEMVSAINNAVAEIVVAAADNNTHQLLLKAYELQQLIVRYGQVSQSQVGADDAWQLVNRGLANAGLDPAVQECLGNNGAYLNDLINALASLAFVKLDNGGFVADHLSGSAQGIVNFTNHILSWCLATHCPGHELDLDKEASPATLQDCFTTLYGLETPMENACKQLVQAMLKADPDSVREKARNFAQVAADDLMSLGEDAVEQAVLQNIEQTLLEAMSSGQDINDLMTAYKTPESPLYRAMVAHQQAFENAYPEVPLVTRVVRAFHDAQIRRLGLGEGMESYILGKQP